MKHKLIKTENYLLVVDDSEIKEGNTYIRIDNELLFSSLKGSNPHIVEKYCKKILAHLPLNNAPILEGVPLLPPLENEVEHIDNLAFKAYKEQSEWTWSQFEQIFSIGYNKAKEKYKYTEEQMKRIYAKGYSAGRSELNSREADKIKYDYIQSLQQPKYPIGFECEMVTMNKGYTEKSDYPYQQCDIPKTTTNSQGLTQLVGNYIYE
jgi:hypothetical protein